MMMMMMIYLLVFKEVAILSLRDKPYIYICDDDDDDDLQRSGHPLAQGPAIHDDDDDDDDDDHDGQRNDEDADMAISEPEPEPPLGPCLLLRRQNGKIRGFLQETPCFSAGQMGFL